jgi:hypothetical protein
MNDGKVGTALIQEFRFNQYCIRLQKLVGQKLDDEFKMFMRWRGFNIDNSLFNIELTAPQNFAAYRMSELDNTRITAFTQLEPLPYMSKRFLMKRFLGLTPEELLENEELWEEERGEPEVDQASGADLRTLGVTPGGLEGDMAAAEEMGDLGSEEMGGDELGGAAAPGPDIGGGEATPAPPMPGA